MWKYLAVIAIVLSIAGCGIVSPYRAAEGQFDRSWDTGASGNSTVCYTATTGRWTYCK